ncbi:hypothetical protein DM02DRAFT_730914 [Periconia macrospinosa]|uniref:Reverse transcriptase domain-containing protein n=1 Tax=Periconia macrospinosa TaxID=97972 RepID=A0A2V1DIH2_9PLEO|nr:hypothetical protein DM02DRAFT_730914 [Periconia macrospinosa]
MLSQSSFLSQTLQSIATTKTREQNKRIYKFETRKTEVLGAIDGCLDERARLEILVKALKDMSTTNTGTWYVDEDRKRFLNNVTRFLEQSRSDSSLSLSVLRDFEAKCLQKLDQESQRFRFADLYYRLLSEWTNSDSEPISNSESKMELDGSYEHVQKYNLQKLKDRFSSVAFTARDTDEVEIDAYLSSLFEDDYAAAKLEKIRVRIADFGREFYNRSAPFDTSTVGYCIRALLTNDLLNDEAKSTLSDFKDNKLVLKEIADVLNLRFADISNWGWECDDGMYYEPRRQGNGKYRIMMDQDILQAIFLHYIAIEWCVQARHIFSEFPHDEKFWQGRNYRTEKQRNRCRFFQPPHKFRRSDSGVDEARMQSFRDIYHMSPLPSSLRDSSDYYREVLGENADTTTGLGIRQTLLRQIATDVLLQRTLRGRVAVVQSDLQWYASGMPHSTLFAVLRFWGVPEYWISFFRKFAEAPLRMDETPGRDVNTRKRGIPITDAFEKFFGETVLFGMDLAVNRLAETTLVRFHDDLWLCGEPSTCAKAWETIEGFVKLFGLDINWSKTGSVYLADQKDEEIASKLPSGDVSMGMLQLTNGGEWAIDQKQVAAHTRQLRKQLGECKSIISWVQVWNACMGSFFQNVVGGPANCFGQGHVDSIVQTFSKIQQELFEDHEGSATNYLREQIKNRFGVESVLDSFFFLPEAFGGLGLKNPFVPFFLLKGDLVKDPGELVEKFLKAELKAYKEEAEAYAALSSKEKRERYKYVFGDDWRNSAIMDETFFSFEEYTQHRETYSSLLKSTYVELMAKPRVQDVSLGKEMEPWFDELCHSHSTGWTSLTSEEKWVMNLFAEELKKHFGALSIIDKNLLPTGCMELLQRKKPTWQLIIWE